MSSIIEITTVGQNEVEVTTTANSMSVEVLNTQAVYEVEVQGLLPTTIINNGGGGSGAVYTHNQSIPNASWLIPHNLGKLYPDITVINSAGDEILGGERIPIDTNNLIINYGAAFGGIAYLQ